jgi:hypothetical protein
MFRTDVGMVLTDKPLRARTSRRSGQARPQPSSKPTQRNVGLNARPGSDATIATCDALSLPKLQQHKMLPIRHYCGDTSSGCDPTRQVDIYCTVYALIHAEVPQRRSTSCWSHASVHHSLTANAGRACMGHDERQTGYRQEKSLA